MLSNDRIKVAIIDYEMGNMFSVQQACEHIGLMPVITSDKNEIVDADAAILPGVGAFGDAMKNLSKLDLVSPIKEFIASNRPFMGICLGMQLLFSESEEFGVHRGLDLIQGNVVKFPAKNINNGRIKVPQIGWNQIFYSRGLDPDSTPLKGLKNGEYMYFVHSYYVYPSDKSNILTNTIYEGINYCSSVIYKNIFASQFHPEKSAWEGIKIYTNWAQKIKKREGVMK